MGYTLEWWVGKNLDSGVALVKILTPVLALWVCANCLTLYLSVKWVNSTVDPWTTWVWTVWVHLWVFFFPVVNITVLHEPRIWRSRGYGRKEYREGWLYYTGFLTASRVGTPNLLLRGQLYLPYRIIGGGLCLADFLESRECLILIVIEHICTHPHPHPPQIHCILGHQSIQSCQRLNYLQLFLQECKISTKILLKELFCFPTHIQGIYWEVSELCSALGFLKHSVNIVMCTCLLLLITIRVCILTPYFFFSFLRLVD